MKTVSARAGKGSPLLRYGVLVIALILWYSFVWDQIAAKNRALEETIEARQAKITRLQGKLKKYSGFEAKLKKAERSYSALEKRLLRGETPQIVASNLQDLLNTAAAEAGLEVTTYRTIKGRKWKKKQLAAVRLTLKGDIAKLVNFLELIKKKNSLIRINSLNIVKVSGRNPYLRINIEAEALCKHGGSA
jgi:type II secretory pathway component PulM